MKQPQERSLRVRWQQDVRIAEEIKYAQQCYVIRTLPDLLIPTSLCESYQNHKERGQDAQYIHKGSNLCSHVCKILTFIPHRSFRSCSC